MNTLIFDSVRSVVYWPITMKFRTCEQTSVNTANKCGCIFSLIVVHLIGFFLPTEAETFQKYIWCWWFSEFHQLNLIFDIYIFVFVPCLITGRLSLWLHMSLQVLQWVMSIISWRMCFQSSKVVLRYSRLQELCKNKSQWFKPTIPKYPSFQ